MVKINSVDSEITGLQKLFLKITNPERNLRKQNLIAGRTSMPGVLDNVMSYSDTWIRYNCSIWQAVSWIPTRSSAGGSLVSTAYLLLV